MKKILVGLAAVFIGLVLIFTGWYMLTSNARKEEADKQKTFESQWSDQQQRIDSARRNEAEYNSSVGR